MFVDNGVEITPDMKQMLRDSADSNPAVSQVALNGVKAALTQPFYASKNAEQGSVLQSGIVFGDTVTGIFKMPVFEWGEPVQFPLDAVSPAEIKLHVAYLMPHEGYIPMRNIEGDYVTMKMYRIATSCDWSRYYAKAARWDVVGRAFEVSMAGMVRKRNNDGHHTIISAAVDRGISIADTSATAGLFTKRLVALAQTVMRRNSGGNSTSIDRGRLSHILLSPEALQDVRSWDSTQVDEVTRREIFIAGEGYPITRIFGVTLVDIDEFGEGQEYQLYYTNTLGATIPSSKSEVAIGLDLVTRVSEGFKMPWYRQDNGQWLQMEDDPTLRRHNRQGFYMDGWMGCGVLESRSVIILGI